MKKLLLLLLSVLVLLSSFAGCNESDSVNTPLDGTSENDDSGENNSQDNQESENENDQVPSVPFLRVNAQGTEDKNGTYILFGEYPQSLKADSVSVTSTTDNRGYYLGSDGAYYAKVTATPEESGYTFANGASVTEGQVYYFKVEPIRWRILSEENGTAFILCDSIIANQAYDAGNNNNYAQSDIRAWLNATFYETAFSAMQQELIQTVTVDNSVYSTGYDPNPYACENTQDKIFLLSCREVTDSAYGFSSSSYEDDTARRMTLSDLARATGAWMQTLADYYGNGYWWLRSPSDDCSDRARAVSTDGIVYGFNHVDYDYNGVVPALKICLDASAESPDEPIVPDKPSTTAYTRVDKDGTPNENGSYILFGEYPQSLKADSVTVGAETDDRGYYLGSDGAYYAKVTATPNWSNYTFANGASVTEGQVYYFKVEPIRWRILSEENGTAFILCDSIIANQAYDADNNGNYSNNYAQSDIRAWLNATFYETAFDALEQELIQTVTVDNSVYSTGYNPNPNACENTQDKVFLLSYREVIDPAYGFSSSSSAYDTACRMTVSDFARATGAYMNTSADYYGNGYWWLRSPDYGFSEYARAVSSSGSVYYGSIYDDYGVVPALQICLD